MSQLSSDQLAQRIYECGLMGQSEIESVLQDAGGRGRASLDAFMMALMEREHLTNWQLARVIEGHRKGYFYGKWKVLYLIGAGTFARVYRSVNRETGEIKAVKVLRSRYSADLESREQFLREARMVMKLRHPNIVPIQEVDEEKDRIYMVMDFVEGQNLRDYVRAHRQIPLLAALRIARDIAAGLAHAAKFGITHRDMKLSNVLLSSKGQARIVDFGLATVSGKDDNDEKGGPRSIDYAGLERTTGVRRNDPRSDIYFLGCMLYHMIAGEPPLVETRERMKRLSAGRFSEVKPITHYVPGLSGRAAFLVSRLMELDANKRIQTPELAVQETESVLRAIEAGDDQAVDPAMTQQQAEEYAAQISDQEEGVGYTLLLIESNIKMQDLLRERLKGLGYRVLITSDPVRGLARFDDLDPADELPADCVIFGCVGLGKQGVNSFAGFVESPSSAKIPAILIAPEELHRLINPKWLGNHRAVFPTPLRMKELRVKLKNLLRNDDDSLPARRAVSTPAPIVVNQLGQPDDTDLETE